MSEDQDEESKNYRMAREMREEFFDRHEFPEEIILETLRSIDIIHVYKTVFEIDRFLIEIKFFKWQTARFHERILKRLFLDHEEIAVFRIRKKLFLRKFRF